MILLCRKLTGFFAVANSRSVRPAGLLKITNHNGIMIMLLTVSEVSGKGDATCVTLFC